MWRAIQRTNIRDIHSLVSFLELTAAQRKILLHKSPFALNLPLRLANKIQKSSLDDPILKQFLPTKDETKSLEGYISDPVGDLASLKETKLLHKYRGRVLLVMTSACAMHCRYCFRQNFPYEKKGSQDYAAEIQYITQDPSIEEVILSGGDPLSLSNKTIASLMDKIGKISHVKRLRFHSRFPIAIPERIDEEFVEMLAKSPLQSYFVIHCNHPKELDDDLFFALRKLQQRGISVLNQAVLLKGINDCSKTLKELFGSLANHGVLAYYLHQLDRVQGSAHFEVSEEKGLELVEAIAKELPGYAVPKYVREIPSQLSKTRIERVQNAPL